MEILRARGVPIEIVDAVNIVYTNTTVQLFFPDGVTDFFEIPSEFSREILWHHIYSLLPWIAP